jgi:hypothetical protein
VKVDEEVLVWQRQEESQKHLPLQNAQRPNYGSDTIKRSVEKTMTDPAKG